MLDKRALYRLPWSMNDNPIAWLEVTDLCNLHCEGCYRQHLSGHKPLDVIRQEVLFFKKWRNPDNVSIAGGEPLLHPNILEVVSFIASNGMKPVILTNARALTPELLQELKRAGCAGFTIHIDSHQDRPGWEGKDEAALNELRSQYAEMIARCGGMYAIFNATVYPATLAEVPAVVRWGQANVDKVQGLVFITYRIGTTENTLALDSANREVDLSRLSYVTERFDERFVTSPQLAQIIKQALPAYAPCAYLGGTILHDSYKWLVAVVIGTRRKALGSIGKKAMEVAQAGHHLLRGTYVAYLSTARIGPAIFLLSPFDSGVRRAARAWLQELLRRPASLFDRPYLQSIAIIQAPDLLPDGRADMCDSCPDMTIYEGKLINSCRMDEYRLFGGFVRALPKEEPLQQARS